MFKEKKHKDSYTDEELVRLIVVSKDTHYFSFLYDRYAKFVYNKCFSFVDSEDEAKDLTHDIFIKIYVNLATFKGNSKLSTWIYAVTYNFCINYINKNKKEGKKQDISILDRVEIEEDDDLYEKELFEINYNKLEEILKQLDVHERAIILMKYQDELSIKEICEILNISASAAKMRLLRAKKKIMELRS